MTKQINAHQKFIRQAPRKLRLVADMVRNMNLDRALIQLQVSSKTAAEPLRKLLIQAKANAVQIGLRSESLTIKTLMIEEGPTFKRWNPVSRGRAHSILKRSSHLRVILEGDDQLKVSKPAEKTKDKAILKKGK